MADRYVLQLPALEVRQGDRKIYCFAVDGKKLTSFTAVSRIRRDDEELQGYQRPEVLSHIRSIRRYLESGSAMLPNALVLAFDKRTKFVPAQRDSSVEYSTPGELHIPVDEAADEVTKPAWLVDGQQRSAAIRDADLAEFPVAVVGFIADSEADQRSQFIMVNSTKPLPKGLIHELLPGTTGQLPPAYERRRLPSELMTRLNSDHDSPFRGIISCPTSPNGYVKDNSILRMIEHSLFEGALYQYRNAQDGTGDVEAMVLHLKNFWRAVRNTFPEEFKLPPKSCRLTHGVGIQALGFVMDKLTETMPADQAGSESVETALVRMQLGVAWTSGTWKFGEGDERRWNGLQNTPNDVRALSTYLQQLVEP